MMSGRFERLKIVELQKLLQLMGVRCVAKIRWDRNLWDVYTRVLKRGLGDGRTCPWG